jgi:hypothetical protein
MSLRLIFLDFEGDAIHRENREGSGDLSLGFLVPDFSNTILRMYK